MNIKCKWWKSSSTSCMLAHLEKFLYLRSFSSSRYSVASSTQHKKLWVENLWISAYIFLSSSLFPLSFHHRTVNARKSESSRKNILINMICGEGSRFMISWRWFSFISFLSPTRSAQRTTPKPNVQSNLCNKKTKFSIINITCNSFFLWSEFYFPDCFPSSASLLYLINMRNKPDGSDVELFNYTNFGLCLLSPLAIPPLLMLFNLSCFIQTETTCDVHRLR